MQCSLELAFASSCARYPAPLDLPRSLLSTRAAHAQSVRDLVSILKVGRVLVINPLHRFQGQHTHTHTLLVLETRNTDVLMGFSFFFKKNKIESLWPALRLKACRVPGESLQSVG